MTQLQGAKRLGITQPHLNDLLRGKIDKFSVDALVNMLEKAGKRVTERFAKQLEPAVKRTTEERRREFVREALVVDNAIEKGAAKFTGSWRHLGKTWLLGQGADVFSGHF